MKMLATITGTTTLCLAGWLAIASWACDKAGTTLIHLGEDE